MITYQHLQEAMRGLQDLKVLQTKSSRDEALERCLEHILWAVDHNHPTFVDHDHSWFLGS